LLPKFVLGILAEDERIELDNHARYPLPAEILAGVQPAEPVNQVVELIDANRLQKPELAYVRGQSVYVARVATITVRVMDLLDRNVYELHAVLRCSLVAWSFSRAEILPPASNTANHGTE
jgi:hypothetical protein